MFGDAVRVPDIDVVRNRRESRKVKMTKKPENLVEKALTGEVEVRLAQGETQEAVGRYLPMQGRL